MLQLILQFNMSKFGMNILDCKNKIFIYRKVNNNYEKIILNISLLNFVSTTSSFLLISQCNQTSTTNYIENEEEQNFLNAIEYNSALGLAPLFLDNEYIFIIKPTVTIVFTKDSKTQLGTIYNMKNGNIFIATNNKLFLMKPDTNQKLKIDIINEPVKSILEFKESADIFIHTDAGIYVLGPNTLNAMKIDGINENVHKLFFNYFNNDIYISTVNQLLYFVKHDTTVSTKIENVEGTVELFRMTKSNVIFKTTEGIFLLFSGKTKAIKVNNMAEATAFALFLNNL